MTDRPILTHPIKIWLSHPSLELRVGFGIPVKNFGPLGITPRTTLILQGANYTRKLDLERALRTRHPQKGHEGTLDL